MWWKLELAKAGTVYQCITLNNWMYTVIIHPSTAWLESLHLFPCFTQGFLMFDPESDLDYLYKLYGVNNPIMWLINDNVRMVTVVPVHEFSLNKTLVFYTVVTAYTEHITPINYVTGKCGLWHTAIRTHMEINAKFFKMVMTLHFQMIDSLVQNMRMCSFSEMILESMKTSISISSLWFINI
jgi:hypothetical protein